MKLPSNLNGEYSVLEKGRKVQVVRKVDTGMLCVGGEVCNEEGEEGRPSEEDVLVRSNNSWPGHVAPAVESLLEAYERVVKALRWGYNHEMPRKIAKSRPLAPAMRSLRCT